MILKPQISGGVLTLHAHNYYSFTNLSELKITVHALTDGKEEATITTQVELAPMSEGDIQLRLGPDLLSTTEVLRLTFDWPDGRNVVTYDVRLKPEKDMTPPHSTDLAGLNFPRLNFSTYDMGPDAKTGWRIAFRHFGHLTHITATTTQGKKQMEEAELSATPLANVKIVDADISMDIVTGKPDPGKKFLKLNVIEKTAESHDVGHVHVEINDGQFTYMLTWKDAKTIDVQELGWTFAMPKAADHFSWHRQGYWSYYPPDQIGRPQGTATPDSANQQMTKLTRVDAFDFNSTKYQCDWASLGGSDGSGIVVICAADDRQQCRGGILDKDAGYSLIVNKQCSPPTDISSDVVPDFYMKLSNGESVHGSFTVAKVGK